jgi:AcrR family transcriptional regulator
MAAKTAPGRPRTTSRDEVQRVALALFAEHGFEATTLDDIAAALGVSRRTLFRYYPSKNDIVWAEFSAHLAGLRERLAGAPPDEPLMDVLRRAVVAFNDYGATSSPSCASAWASSLRCRPCKGTPCCATATGAR